MKNYSTQQEILLMPNTSFLRNQWLQKNGRSSKHRNSLAEDIEHACWNGMIYEMLPEVIEKAKSNEKLFLLDVRQDHEFIEMEFGENYFRNPDHILSISPLHFFSNAKNN
jgi:hypothetical protein